MKYLTLVLISVSLSGCNMMIEKPRINEPMITIKCIPSTQKAVVTSEGQLVFIGDPGTC